MALLRVNEASLVGSVLPKCRGPQVSQHTAVSQAGARRAPSFAAKFIIMEEFQWHPQEQENQRPLHLPTLPCATQPVGSLV